jgi:hypothetical protein
MDFSEEMTGVGAGVKLPAFRQVASNRKLRAPFPSAARGLVRITGALRSLCHETYNPGPNGNRPEHRGPACPLDYRD